MSYSTVGEPGMHGWESQVNVLPPEAPAEAKPHHQAATPTEGLPGTDSQWLPPPPHQVSKLSICKMSSAFFRWCIYGAPVSSRLFVDGFSCSLIVTGSMLSVGPSLSWWSSEQWRSSKLSQITVPHTSPSWRKWVCQNPHAGSFSRVQSFRGTVQLVTYTGDPW